MAEQAPNTIWIRAYTPAGRQVGISVAFEAGKITPASELDAMVEEAGYLIAPEGVEAGEWIETMGSVMRRTKYNDDRTETPIIAFYSDNPRLSFKRDSMYFNTLEEIAEFEALAGMKITDIPNYEGTDWLERQPNNPQSKKYIKQLPKPIKCALAIGTWNNPKTKESGTTDKIQRFLDVPTTPDNITDMPKRDNNNSKSTKTEKAPWLSDKEETDKIKQQLEFFALDGDDLVAKARAKIDPKINSFYLPEDYLKAIENEINSLKVGA